MTILLSCCTIDRWVFGSVRTVCKRAFLVEKKAKRKKVFLGILLVFTLIMFALTIVGLVIFNIQVSAYEASGIDDYTTYSKLYAYIPDDPDSTVSQTLYQDLREYGLQHDCFVELIGSDLAASYTKEELITIAIKSKVSGIILEGDSSEETIALIKQASDAGIPVVTVMTDAIGSDRCSFIGLNNYSAGVEYGNLIIETAAERTQMEVNALVIMSSGGGSESVIYAAIQEKLQGSGIILDSVVVESDTTFSAEEKITDILDSYSRIPDIIVCLSDLNTRSAYQYIVDKNCVGSTTIIGYYDSDTVLEAIERGAIDATFSVDTRQVAENCVNALNDYIDYGNVSEYFSSDYIKIDIFNVSHYIQAEDDREAADEEG